MALAPRIPTIKTATAQTAAAPTKTPKISAETRAKKNRYDTPGRPVTKPDSVRVGFYLPQPLLEKLEAAAAEKTFGNKSQMLVEILEGRASL